MPAWHSPCYIKKVEKKVFKMKKISLSFIPLFLIILIGQSAYAGPHVSTAEPHPKGSLTVGYQEEYFHSKKVQFGGENDFHGSSMFLNYAPFSSLELFVARKTFLNNNSKILSTLQSVSFTKSELGSKIFLHLSQKDFLGLETAYVLLNGNNVPVFRGSSGRVRLLNTTHLPPFKLHFNTEFFYSQAKKVLEGFDLSRFEHNELYGLSKRNTVSYGLGLEWATLHLISPYLEYSLDQALGSKDKVPSFFKNPHRLTLGMTFLPSHASPWKLHLAGDYGFATKRYEGVALAPKFSIFAGLSFSSQSSNTSTVTEKTEEKSAEKKGEETSEEKIEAPQTSAYPIYPMDSSTPEEVSIQTLSTPLDLETLRSQKWPIYPIKKSKKKIIVKKLETLKTPEPSKPVERSLPEIPITTQDQAPVIVETPVTKTQPEPKQDTPPSTKELEKNYSEESENKDFLNQFR